jgi:putative membrane protein
MSGPWTPAAPLPSTVDAEWDRPSHRWLLPVVGAVLVAVLVLGLLAWTVLPGPGPMGGSYGHMWFFFPFGFFFLIFVLFMIVRIAFWSTRGSRYAGRGRRFGPRAILQARYARGEITRDQFLQMQRDLDEAR